MIKIKNIFNREKLTSDFDKGLFLNLNWSYDRFVDHQDVTKKLVNKNPYTVTVILENLRWELKNKKEYVKKTKTSLQSKFNELLYEHFFEEFDQYEGNQIYARWLKKYSNDDKKIISLELEKRYKDKIFRRFKNKEKLFAPRFKIERNRKYNLPEPLNRIDYRNFFDNLFIWQENGRKFVARGGSGSSGARETNSIFAYGFMEINKIKPVPSHIFLYSDSNQLLFLRSFKSLCLPTYDVGSNYFLKEEGSKKLRLGTKFIEWKDFSKLEEVNVY